MSDFVRDAGWGIWPVLVCGALSLLLTVRYALAPRRERLAAVVGLALATVLFGALGTIIGLQASVRYLDQVGPTERWIFLVGLRESLNNLSAALALVILDALIATAGASRATSRIALSVT